MSTTSLPTLKQRLARGEIIRAITLVTPNVETAAHVATLGFDVLWVEMEHSPITLESLRSIVLATHRRPAVVLARVPVNELWTAKRVLDQGVAGVIFPFVRTGDDARRAAAACRYPPTGCRGSGAGLALTTWPHAGAYYDSADEHVITVAVVEDAAAVDAIDDIAATPGIDVVFIGTSDLAFSFGCRGDHTAPVVERAIDKIVAAAQRHGKPLGRPAATPQQITEGTARGFQFFQTVTELGLMTRGAAAFLERTGAEGLPPTISPRPMY